jgi:hypothetical protein
LRTSNWFIWLIILGVGWTVAGGIATVLVTQLGFPYAWIYPLTLVMLGAVLFLVYRGYPWQAWGLTACVGFILITLLAIGHSVIVGEPDIPAVYRAEFESATTYNSLFGIDWPLYTDFYGDSYIEYTPDRTAYLYWPDYNRYDARSDLTIEFAPFDTAGGQWAFMSGELQAGGSISGTYRADPNDNWRGGGDVTFDVNQPVRAAQPNMTVLVPTLWQLMAGRASNLAATMTIRYPDASGEVVETTLTRQFTLTTPGADFSAAYQKYFDWQRARSVTSTPMWLVLLVGSVLAGAGSVVMWREGALIPQPSSGLQMVVRRLSGAQKLGVDVHPLDRFRDETDAERGVFVGRVVAQSPAGRSGLRTGDVLLELDGKPTNTPAAINRIGKGRKRGDTVIAHILRHGEEIELTIRF